jgi:ankyrin repeat protein
LTQLHDGALSGRAPMIALLLDKGANREARDRQSGATPLYQAASWGRRAAVELLIARGADVNAKSNTGVSPAQAAAKNGFAEIARLLQERGSK